MKLKTLKDLTKSLGGNVTREELRQEAINSLKRLRYLIDCYTGKIDLHLEQINGSFWKCKEGKEFNKMKEMGLINIDDYDVYISINFFNYFFNITEEDLK